MKINRFFLNQNYYVQADALLPDFVSGIAAALSWFCFFAHIIAFADCSVALLITVTCYIANYILAKILKSATNVESAYITALILTLIMPTKLPVNLIFFDWRIGTMTYAWQNICYDIEKRHIFNPVAASVVAISLISPEHAATWWVGTPLMLPFVLVGWIACYSEKMQRGQMVMYFCSLIFWLLPPAYLLVGGSLIPAILTLWQKSILYSPVFFFSFAMLTEPLTSPANTTAEELLCDCHGAIFRNAATEVSNHRPNSRDGALHRQRLFLSD